MKDEVNDLLAYIGGLSAFAIAIALQFFIVGSVYGSAEALALVEGLSSSALYYGAALATSSATVLGLLFTVIGMALRSEEKFETTLYARVARLSVFCVAMLIGSVLLLLVLSMPVGEFDELPANWYKGLYYFLGGLLSILTGLAVTVILQLFLAVRQVLQQLTPLESMWGRTKDPEDRDPKEKRNVVAEES